MGSSLWWDLLSLIELMKSMITWTHLNCFDFFRESEHLSSGSGQLIYYLFMLVVRWTRDGRRNHSNLIASFWVIDVTFMQQKAMVAWSWPPSLLWNTAFRAQPQGLIMWRIILQFCPNVIKVSRLKADVLPPSGFQWKEAPNTPMILSLSVCS